MPRALPRAWLALGLTAVLLAAGFLVMCAFAVPDLEGTVMAAGDIASCGSSGDEQTAALLAEHPLADILLLGDNAYEDGTASEYSECYHPGWGAYRARTHPAPGNHEYHDSHGDNPNAEAYYAYFGAAAGPATNRASRGYYSFDYFGWHIVSLNSEQDIEGAGEQLAWLRADLARSTEKCVLAFWHRPRFSAGKYSDDASIQPFWDALYAARAEIVLNGHDHNYQRFPLLSPTGAPDANGIRQFIVGTGGRSSYALRDDARREAGAAEVAGVLKLTLRADSYDWEFLPVAGQTYTDSGTGVCR